LNGDLASYLPDADQPFKSAVYFDYDKSTIKSGEISKVEHVAKTIKGMAGKALRIEGHCDERGTEEYNRSLGERRALAVREALVRAGVEANQIDTISYGEDRPADPGHNEAAWSKNRRGEFIVIVPPNATATNTPK
jgi:peptidoglycan-associated lipoprotein